MLYVVKASWERLGEKCIFIWPPKEMTLYLDVNEIQIEVKLK
tara:strand:+ start:62 stop:187 length:126 start_codon:yes stop_codon:yes gene_type:complete